MSLAPALNSEDEYVVSAPPFLHLRLAYFISVWSFKAAIAIGLTARRIFIRRPLALLQPEIKSYPVRPLLKNRIFRPEGCGDEKLPLYIDVHGGGWAVANPEVDDEFCSFMAQNFKIVVVSVNYRKSPSWKFPFAVNDVAAIAKAVIEDSSLNIDSKNVAMGGFSAGGNLAFGASLTEQLKGRVSALVGFYTPLNLTETLDCKLKRRPQNAPTDILKSSANFLDWAYVPLGTNRKDPLLSPAFAKRDDLARNVYLVGAEYDMLCYEALQMAESLTDSAHDRTSIPALAPEDGWRQGNIRWECARGRNHAFTHVTEWGKKEKARVKAVEEMYYRIGTWLNEDVWE